MTREPSSATHPPPPDYALQPRDVLTPSEVLQHYEELTFPPIGRRIALRPPGGLWQGALAFAIDAPIGLVVTQAGGDGTFQVLSLAVLPEHRGRGVGSALVATAERLAAEAGAAALEGAYRTSWRSRPAIEALLASRGWSAPETRMVLARGETGFARRFLRTPARDLPTEAEIFAWEDLTEVEREEILARQLEDPWYPEILTPFQEEPRLEPTISVGLRWRGEVAGWMIAHRVAFDTLQYSAFFVREELRGLGLGMALVREAIRRRLADPDLRHAILAVDARNRRVRAWVEGDFRTYFASTSELRVSRKLLDA